MIGPLLLSLAFGIQSIDAKSDPGAAVGQLGCGSLLARTQAVATLFKDRSTIITVGHFQGNLSDPQCAFKVYSRSEGWIKIGARPLQFGGGAFERKLSVATDWATLRLDRPVPQDLTPAQPLVSEKAEHLTGSLRLPGASSRISTAPRQMSCSLSRQERAMWFTHTCATKPGYSGAPIFVSTLSGTFLMAMHVGRLGAGGAAVLIDRTRGQ